MSSRTKKGSHNEWLSTFEVGERRYVETTLARYAHTMRTVVAPRSRRPDFMSGMEFSSSLYTAISAAEAGDIRFLICVERTA